VRNQAILDEGDPNGLPWRNREGGPRLEWVAASELKPGDRVMQGNKYVHTVRESVASDASRWRLIIADPEMAPSASGRAEKVSAAIPKTRELIVAHGFLYRRLVG